MGRWYPSPPPPTHQRIIIGIKIDTWMCFFYRINTILLFCIYSIKKTKTFTKTMVKINSEGEYLLKSGAGSIFRKYTQNGLIPPTATIVGDTPPPPFGYKFLNNAELMTAVDMWIVSSSQDDAIKKYGDIQYWDVSEVKDMSHLFSPSRSGVNGTVNTALMNFNGNISDWDVSKVSSMGAMFSGVTAFNQPIGNWDVSEVTNMSFMLGGATAFNQVLDKWDVGKVTSMVAMFAGATAFMANGSTTYSIGVAKWKPGSLGSGGGIVMFQGVVGSTAPWSGLIASGFLTINGTVNMFGTIPGTGFFHN
jgi:surface protein